MKFMKYDRYVMGIDTEIEVGLDSAISPHPKAKPLWPTIEVSISILSFYYKVYQIHAGSVVYKHDIEQKIALSQPIWKALWQTIVTAASLVTPW